MTAVASGFGAAGACRLAARACRLAGRLADPPRSGRVPAVMGRPPRAPGARPTTIRGSATGGAPGSGGRSRGWRRCRRGSRPIGARGDGPAASASFRSVDRRAAPRSSRRFQISTRTVVPSSPRRRTSVACRGRADRSAPRPASTSRRRPRHGARAPAPRGARRRGAPDRRRPGRTRSRPADSSAIPIATHVSIDVRPPAPASSELISAWLNPTGRRAGVARAGAGGESRAARGRGSPRSRSPRGLRANERSVDSCLAISAGVFQPPLHRPLRAQSRRCHDAPTHEMREARHRKERVQRS